MNPELQESLAEELRALAAQARLRALPATDYTASGASVDGRPIRDFCSNDYLGLALDPRVRGALVDAPAGARASRLVIGDLPIHRRLEATFAGHHGSEAALLFPSGYQANLGVLTALAGRDDLIVSDQLNHASLIDGCRLSRATVRVYAHADPAAARVALADANHFRRRFLVTESVFSMDGDIAPLSDLADVAAHHGCALIVDEAHAAGALGRGGRGIASELGLQPDAIVLTLGKAYGAGGGVVLGTTVLREILINRARTFIFTTGLAPGVAAAAQAALEIAVAPEGAQLRERLCANIDRLAERLGRGGHRTPIHPVILGSDRAALAASAALRSTGFFVPAIRPPTVPEGTARLRITLSAAHDPRDIDALADAILGLSPP